jgi:hypothetical protein
VVSFCSGWEEKWLRLVILFGAAPGTVGTGRIDSWKGSHITYPHDTPEFRVRTAKLFIVNEKQSKSRVTEKVDYPVCRAWAPDLAE